MHATSAKEEILEKLGTISYTNFIRTDSIDRRLSDSKEQSSETDIFVFVHNTNSFT